ncbi:Hypothetical predicted protein [Marmota monax]|uniref:Kinase n=1 Tax=Marmota monax TaxID=9995 RepID=A0A5E4CG12_MARMO|nr:Hypothetical predicted protein [Marmota monax]
MGSGEEQWAAGRATRAAEAIRRSLEFPAAAMAHGAPGARCGGRGSEQSPPFWWKRNNRTEAPRDRSVAAEHSGLHKPRSGDQTEGGSGKTSDGGRAGRRPCCLSVFPAVCVRRMSPAFRAMDVEPRTKGVLLEPFVHQVGGHSCVLRFNETTLCKPLVPREHQFYETLPAEMRRFTPQYKGVVSVRFEEDEDRNLCLIAYPLKGDHGTVDFVDNSDCEPKSKLLRWTNKKHHMLEMEKTPKDWVRQHRKEEKMKSHKLEEEFEWLKKSEVLYYSVEKKGSISSQLKHYNPWSMKCHQQQLQRMKENAKHRNQYKFILLENLTSRYEVPCVLDLKMGTRQHGDDASEEKAANQIRKCQQSTSAVIGVRVCGMQVSNVLVQDKG